MAKIVLIACANKKIQHKSKVRNLYVSSLFRKSLRYAESISPDKIFILSDRHGLLRLKKEIEPYDKDLKKMRINERRTWADSVLSELKKSTHVTTDEFIFLAGKRYWEFLLPHIKHCEILMQGLRIGERLQWLNKH